MAWPTPLLVALAASSASSHHLVCYSAWGPTSRAEARSLPAALLRESVAVVRAVATDSFTVADSSAGASLRSRVRFRVLEVLRGDSMPSVLTFPGWITGQNDFNPGRVPYADVRPGGEGGSCFAFNYRLGGEYLFLLQRAETTTFFSTKGVLTPYWAPLRPTHEQLHGEADPWLRWIRQTLGRHSSSAPGGV